jgi:hypothetical protein
VIDRSTTRDTPMDPVALFIGRSVVWNLLSRKPSWPAFMCERIDRPDIWTQRSDQNAAKDLARRGPSTYGSRLMPPNWRSGSGRTCA